jgi:hypothetical protein
VHCIQDYGRRTRLFIGYLYRCLLVCLIHRKGIAYRITAHTNGFFSLDGLGLFMGYLSVFVGLLVCWFVRALHTGLRSAHTNGFFSLDGTYRGLGLVMGYLSVFVRSP